MSQEYSARLFNLHTLPVSTVVDSPTAPNVSESLVHPQTGRNGGCGYFLRWNAELSLSGLSLSSQQQQPRLLKDTVRVSDQVITDQHTCLSIHTHSTFLSYLQFSIRQHVHPMPADLPATIIRMTSDTCRILELHEIDQNSYNHLTQQELCRHDKHFYLMFVEFIPDRICSERLFVQDLPLSLQPLKDTMRSTNKLGVLLSDRLSDDNPSSLRTWMSSLTTRFSAEVISNPLSPWLRKEHHHRHRPGNIPVYSTKPRNSFFDMNDYLATMGVGAKIVWDITEKDVTQSFPSPMQIFQLEEENNHRFGAIFQVPRKHPGNFSSGDKASAYLTLDKKNLPTEYSDPFDGSSDSVSSSGDNESVSNEDTASCVKRERRRGFWDIRMLEPIPSAPSGVVFATLERWWDKKNNRYCDKTKYPVISPEAIYETGQGTISTIRSLLNDAKVFAQIFPEDRHSIFPYVFKALDDLGTNRDHGHPSLMYKGLLELLLGNNFDTIPVFDIYQSLKDPTYACEEDMNLNEGQKAGIQLGRAAPAGFVICQGPPGTGKTHFVVQAVKPFFLDAGRRHHVLLTSAGNRGADAMAVALETQLQQLIKEGKTPADRYVLRLHSIKTEKCIALREANSSRQKIVRDQLSNSSTPRTTRTRGQPQSLSQSAAILAHCCTFSAPKFEGVEDERVQNIEISAGRRMLQTAGIMPGGVQAASSEFADFANLYDQYSKGKPFNDQMSTKLEERLDELLAHTIKNATAICATVGGAADNVVTNCYSDAELIVVDEAARVPEYQMWPLLAFYPKAVGKIMVGDLDQLRPTVEVHDKIKNPFQAQLEISLQERIQSAGFKSAFFNVQYRAVPDIANIYSNATYKSRLVNDPSTYMANRPLAEKVAEHNSRNYGSSSPVVFYDVPAAVEGHTDRGSKFCKQYAILVLKILEELLVAGFGGPATPCTIAVLTTYKEQERILRIAKVKMERVYPEAANVILETAGKVQGIEYDIVIVDPARVTAPGFLDKNRLNVLFSRAKDGLYVVGHYDSWRLMKFDDSIPLKAFNQQLKQYRITWNGSQALVSRFFDDNVLWAF